MYWSLLKVIGLVDICLQNKSSKRKKDVEPDLDIANFDLHQKI
jgi:hypothetical protein